MHNLLLCLYFLMGAILAYMGLFTDMDGTPPIVTEIMSDYQHERFPMVWITIRVLIIFIIVILLWLPILLIKIYMHHLNS